MHRVMPFLLVLHLGAADTQSLPQRLQQTLRLAEPELMHLQRDLSRSPESSTKAYWQSMVEYGMVGLAKDPKVADALAGAAMKRLEGRTDADSLALMGSLYGVRIGLHPEEAMSLVGKAMACFGRAKALSPHNPRVRFFEGIHMLNTPEAFGGGPTVGLPLLETALALAEAEKAATDPCAPAWGKIECLAWLALAEARAGKKAPAQVHLEQCLKLDPGYGFAVSFVAPLVKQ